MVLQYSGLLWDKLTLSFGEMTLGNVGALVVRFRYTGELCSEVLHGYKNKRQELLVSWEM